MKRIAIASDHAGFALKEKLKAYLKKARFVVKDFGTYSEQSCDYPDVAELLAKAVSLKKFNRGVVICGSGIGVSIVANKFRGVRAALCHNPEIARVSRQHNDSNVLAMGSRFINATLAKKILKVWLETKFEGGRHARRVDKINIIECKLRSRR